MRWSCGADGLDPRLAQPRVIPFFWPIRASSWNRISITLPLAGSGDLCQCGGEVFQRLDRLGILRMMHRASRGFAAAYRAHFAAQGLLAHRDMEFLPKATGPDHTDASGRRRRDRVLGRARWLAPRPCADRRSTTTACPEPCRRSNRRDRALNRTTQSRTICTVTLPSRAASAREPPSYISTQAPGEAAPSWRPR